MTLKFLECQARIKKNINKNFFITLFTVKLCTVFKLVLCLVIKLNIFRTSSPPTSCYRLGLCLSTPTRSWWSWSTSGRTNKNGPSVTITWTKTKSPFNLKIKFTLKQDLNWLKQRYWTRGWPVTIWPCGATETESGWPRDDPALRRFQNWSGWPWDGAWTSGQSRSSGRKDVEQSRKTWNPWLVKRM
jgi:hypothetical protein